MFNTNNNFSQKNRNSILNITNVKNKKDAYGIKHITDTINKTNMYKNTAESYIEIPVLYINLNRSPDRRKYMEKQFDIYNIKYTRIQAIDGNKICSNSYINNYKDLSPSEIGCTLSHLKAIKYAKSKNMKIALILEDDVDFCLTTIWQQKLVNLINSAPPNWGIIQLFTFKQKCKYDNKFYLHNTEDPCYSTAAYIINTQGITDIIKHTGTQKYTMGKLINGNITPKDGRADRFIYDLTTTYYYATPLFTVNDENLSSTIHTSHSNQHIKRSNDILNLYSKYNKIDNSDIDKQYIFAKSLTDFDDFLISFNVTYFLLFGTLLGVIRDGTFISHDTDIDVGVFPENFNNKILNGNKNFKLSRKFGSIESGGEFTFQHLTTNINIDIFIVYTSQNNDKPYKWTSSFTGLCDKSKNKMCRWKTRDFSLTQTPFLNRMFNIPKKAENFLRDHYGPNWNIPIKFDYHDGLNKGLYRGLIQTDFKPEDRVTFTEDEKITDLYPMKINKMIQDKPIIWMYWQNQDENSTSPGYLDLCLQSIYTNCQEKFHIIILDDMKVKAVSRTIHKNFQNITPLGMRADYIRFTLVSEYGGIWLDCDTAVINDISYLIQDLQTYNFIGFSHNNTADISTGLFAGNKNNRVCKYFKYLFENDKKFCKWTNKPYNIQWAGPTKIVIEYMKTLIDMYPNSYKTYHAPTTVYPIHWKKSKDYYWGEGTIDNHILNFSMIYFHNETYTDEMKAIPGHEIINMNYRISDLFRKIL